MIFQDLRVLAIASVVLEVRNKVQDYRIAQDYVRMLCARGGVIQLSRSSQASPWLSTKMIFQD